MPPAYRLDYQAEAMPMRNLLASGAIASLLCAGIALAADAPPGCDAADCGIRRAAAYPHLVIGRLVRVASEAEMRALYRWARAGAWKGFGDSEADYLERNRLLILPADDAGTPVWLHMSHEEYRRVTFQSGDLLRYTPRTAGGSDAAPSIYSALAGCIAILCRAEDRACAQQYRAGVFRRADGVQIDFVTEAPLPAGVTIDPLSLLPRGASAGVSQQ